MAGNGVVADLQDDSKGRLRSTVILVALADSDPPNKPKRNKLAFACAFLVSLTTIILGYDMGVMSGAIMFIKKDFDITDVEIQVLVGIINFYSIIGSLLAGKTSDWIGRRYTIMLADAIFFAAALLMAFATNYAFLMVGRFVAGIGVGYALTIAPVYIAEVSPPASRGYLTSFPEEKKERERGKKMGEEMPLEIQQLLDHTYLITRYWVNDQSSHNSFVGSGTIGPLEQLFKKNFTQLKESFDNHTLMWLSEEIKQQWREMVGGLQEVYNQIEESERLDNLEKSEIIDSEEDVIFIETQVEVMEEQMSEPSNEVLRYGYFFPQSDCLIKYNDMMSSDVLIIDEGDATTEDDLNFDDESKLIHHLFPTLDAPRHNSSHIEESITIHDAYCDPYDIFCMPTMNEKRFLHTILFNPCVLVLSKNLMNESACHELIDLKQGSNTLYVKMHDTYFYGVNEKLEWSRLVFDSGACNNYLILHHRKKMHAKNRGIHEFCDPYLFHVKNLNFDTNREHVAFSGYSRFKWWLFELEGIHSLCLFYKIPCYSSLILKITNSTMEKGPLEFCRYRGFKFDHVKSWMLEHFNGETRSMWKHLQGVA